MNADPLLPILIELLLKGAALVTITLSIDYSLRRRISAAARHALWAACVVALLALPLFRIISPLWTYNSARQQAAASAPFVRVPTPGTSTLPLTPPDSSLQASPVRWSPVPRLSAAQWCLVLWVSGAAILLLRRLAAITALTLLSRRRAPLNDGRLLNLARLVADQFGVTRKVSLRVSNAQTIPVTWGAWRPVLLLPANSCSWSDTDAAAVFRHEFAHIYRNDYLTRLAGSLAVALQWPNPLVWLAYRRLCETQELACDDLVLASGSEAESYAHLLIDAARSAASATWSMQSTVAMARASSLETRVLAICDHERNRAPINSRTILTTTAAATVLLAASGLAQVAGTSPGLEPSEAGLAAPETRPRNPQSPIQREYVVPPSLFGDFPMRPDDQLTDVSRFFAAKGVAVPNGGVCVFRPSSEILLVRMPQDSLDTVDSIVEAYLAQNSEIVAQARDPLGNIGQILIPHFEVREASPQEALAQLEKESRRLDPNGRGIRTVLNAPEEAKSLRISISLKNIPLAEALKYLTNLMSARFKVQGERVIVTLLQTPNSKNTILRSIALPAALLTENGHLRGRGGQTYPDAVAFLQAGGIVFAPESTAAIIDGGQAIRIRATPDQIELAEAVIAAQAAGGR